MQFYPHPRQWAHETILAFIFSNRDGVARGDFCGLHFEAAMANVCATVCGTPYPAGSACQRHTTTTSRQSE
jgi:hypothetical protein